MRAIYRDTRAKWSINPTGYLIYLVFRYMRIKIARQLRAFRAAAWPFLLLLTLSCAEDPIFPDTCLGGCDGEMLWEFERDENGYYHVPLDWTGDYLPYFYIDVDATPTDEYWHYNGVPAVSAKFDSDTSWVVGDSLVVQVPFYSPFGNYTQQGLALPVGYNDIVLSQYAGTVVNIAQPTTVNFHEKDGKFQTRRYLGPFIPSMIGDTITVYMEIYWDAGSHSQRKSDYFQKFIIE